MALREWLPCSDKTNHGSGDWLSVFAFALGLQIYLDSKIIYIISKMKGVVCVNL